MGDCSKEIKLEKARPEQFYSVFKSHANRLKTICPDIVRDIQLADGATDWEAVPSLRKTIDYQFTNGKRYKITDKVDKVDASTKTISYIIVEGEIKDNISKFELQVKDNNTALWTISYNNTYPEEYFKLLASITKGVDNHFANEN